MKLEMVSVKDTCPTPKCGFRVRQVVSGTTHVKCLNCKTTITLKDLK